MTTVASLENHLATEMRSRIEQTQADLSAGRVPSQADIERLRELVDRLERTGSRPPVAALIPPAGARKSPA